MAEATDNSDDRDAELQALEEVIAALMPFDQEARLRILSTARVFFNIPELDNRT